MANILFLSQLLPYPPDAGPKVRSYHTLRYLAQRHRVTLLAFTRAGDTPEALETLGSLCAEVHTVPITRSRKRDARALAASWLNGMPFVIQRDHVAGMVKKVDQLLHAGRMGGQGGEAGAGEKPFDVVHADQLWMAQYALQARDLPGVRLVLDEHNACFQIFQRLAAGEANPVKRGVLEREWRALKRYETRTVRLFDRVVTVTNEDRAILEGLEAESKRTFPRSGSASAPKFSTLPICVDTQATQPVVPRPDSYDVLHLGTMFWLPNVEGVLWFTKEVWPRVLAQVPQAKFTIVGKNPPPVVMQLGNVQNQPSPGEVGPTGIRITGYIRDPQPYLEKAAAFIVPLLSGSGMRVKILEGWARGLPVIATRIGAEGIQYREGENILIADRAEDFAQAVIRVLCDKDLGNRLRAGGRAWVEEHYEWRRVYPGWEAIYAGK